MTHSPGSGSPRSSHSDTRPFATTLVAMSSTRWGDAARGTPAAIGFVASLASCTAFYARRYLARHQLPVEGLRVETSYEMGTHPSRVTRFDVRVLVPEGVPPERHAALLAMIDHCTVHSTLQHEPEVDIRLVTP